MLQEAQKGLKVHCDHVKSRIITYAGCISDEDGPVTPEMH